MVSPTAFCEMHALGKLKVHVSAWAIPMAPRNVNAIPAILNGLCFFMMMFLFVVVFSPLDARDKSVVLLHVRISFPTDPYSAFRKYEFVAHNLPFSWRTFVRQTFVSPSGTWRHRDAEAAVGNRSDEQAAVP